jgi:imidazolonepropionase-like amidohydrolase
MSFEERYSRLLMGYDRDLARTLMQRLAKNGTWIDPTLTVANRVATSGEMDYERDPRRKYISPKMWASWQAGTRSAMKGVVQQLVLKDGELISLAREANVGLLGGTDTGASNPFVFPGFGVHEELAALVEAGLTPMEALQTATRNAAMFMGMADTLGTIQRGKVADLLVLNRNPLENIRNTESIETVVLRGRVLPRQELDTLLAGVAATATAD